jgi:hypothetical protein
LRVERYGKLLIIPIRAKLAGRGADMRVRYTVAAFAVLTGVARAAPLDVPFDFSRNEIALSVSVKGVPQTMLLDTGVDPSAIDITRAKVLKLSVDRKDGGEISGQGNAKSALAYPSQITGLSIAGRSFKAVEAIAADLGAFSASYGAELDGVLGYSFIKDQRLVLDYGKRRVIFIDSSDDAHAYVKTCKKSWRIPLKTFGDDAVPAVPIRIGAAAGLISLDTGSSGGMTLYPDTLNLAGVKNALVEKGVSHGTGARGTTTAKSYLLELPVSFGPFTTPPGQLVVLHENKGFSDSRIANVGNKFFADLGLKIVLDYRGKMLGFYGACSAGQ